MNQRKNDKHHQNFETINISFSKLSYCCLWNTVAYTVETIYLNFLCGKFSRFFRRKLFIWPVSRPSEIVVSQMWEKIFFTYLSYSCEKNKKGLESKNYTFSNFDAMEANCRYSTRLLKPPCSSKLIWITQTAFAHWQQCFFKIFHQNIWKCHRDVPLGKG